MSSDFNKELFQKHQLEILVIDLNQSTYDEDKYLCIKCLIDKIDNKSIFTVQETKTMIKQMKIVQQNNNIQEYQRSIENFKQIKPLVQELKVSTNNTIDKIYCNIDQKITLMEKGLNELQQKKCVSSFKDEVQTLSKIYKGSFSFEIPKELEKFTNDNQYIDSIEQQLQSISNCPILIQITDSLQKIKVQNEDQQMKLLIKNNEDPQKLIFNQKSPSLKIQCNQHGKEIIMINLNPEITQISRLACVECIQSNDPIKYTTIGDANFKWNEYLKQTSNQFKNFQNQRSLKSSQIIEILQDTKEKYNSTISDIINKLNNQYSTPQNETNEFNDNIFQMNNEQVNELTKILSQNDKFQALAEKEINIQKEDLHQFEIISTNFGKLLENYQIATEKLNQIMEEYLNMSNQEDLTNDIVSDDNSHILNLLQFKQPNLKFQYLEICKNEALKQYKLFIQTISSLSNQFTGDQLQQFNQQISQLKKDLSLNQEFFQQNQIETELKLKESRQNQHKEFENINQQCRGDFEKFNGEQIELISQLKDQNVGLSVKLKELEQQKTLYELILKEIQLGLQCQQLNQNNEEILKQLQQTLVLQNFQLLTFSSQYKHSDCIVTQNGKVIETSSDSCYQCCMCDQRIPKNVVIQFTVKIIEIQNIMIGICIRDIVQSKLYAGCYSSAGGTYTIQFDGISWTHDQIDKSGQPIEFKFSANDIIIVEVDIQKKYVKWKKQSTDQSFTLAIDTSKDLYPCVNLKGRCKVEILNQALK